MIKFLTAPEYLLDFEKPGIPPELMLSRQLGEHRMLSGGGLYDQPIEWMAVQRAGYLDSFISRTKTTGFKLSDLSADEVELHQEINKIAAEAWSRR